MEDAAGTAQARRARMVVDALEQVRSGLSESEDRPGQRAMALAVAEALAEHRHLVVSAGTGTGKTLGYLVPAVALGSRCVVATATKALQDQLATKDLPLVSSRMGTFRFAVLKGRSNYLCRQRASEMRDAGEQLAMGVSGAPAGGASGDGSPGGGASGGRAGGGAGLSGTAFGREVRALLKWAEKSPTGERSELTFEPSPVAWGALSVGHRECPGASNCPSGGSCFAEAARRRAAEADVVVVNTHLYASHLAANGELLPSHDLVVFDEAHLVEEVASASLGFEINAARLRAIGRLSRPLVTDPTAAVDVENSGATFEEMVEPYRGQRVAPAADPELMERLTLVRERVAALQGALGKGDDAGGPDPSEVARRRAVQATSHLIGELDQVLALADHQVAWVEGGRGEAILRVAPIDVGEELTRLLWSQERAPTAVMTSATITPRLGRDLGLGADAYDAIDVGSPFDYQAQALLYCPVHLPDPRNKGHEEAMLRELIALVRAAEGRTMALFTSWRAMSVAAARLATEVPWPILSQAELPKPALVDRFSKEENSCLFATMGFWQGVDVPGPALSVVAIDRIPFPRPDDPLLQARRERLGPAAFASLDLPRAATLLAQGVGRLIRNGTDRGVVAVLDPRLARAPYRWELVNALPPMRRTRHRSEVEAFLAPLRAGLPAGPGS